MNTRALFFAVLLIVIVPNRSFAQSPQTVVAQVDEEGLGLAESLLRQNRPDDAEKLALRALKANPESLEARTVLAKVAITRGELEKAQDFTDQLLGADSNEPDFHALQGMIFMFQDRFEDATESLQESIRLGKDGKATSEQMASYVTTLALNVYRAGDKYRALKISLEGVEDYPKDPDLHLVCSRLYRESGDFQSALEVAELGLKSHPDFPGLYASIALAQAGLGNTEASELAFQQLLKRDPELAKALRETLDGVRPDDPEYRVRTN